MLGHHRLLAAVVTAALCGCAQTGKLTGSIPWMKTPPPVAEAKAETPADEPAKTEPVKKSEVEVAEKAEKKEATPKPDEKPSEDAIAAADPATDTKPADPQPADKPADDNPADATIHDAETLALIDEELKLVSPEERETLFAEWKSLDGAMVQQIIRIRRMVRELESSSPSSTAVATSSTNALPGTTSPWGANVAPTSTNGAPSAIASNLTAVENVQLAQALPTIQPAGQATASSVPSTATTQLVSGSVEVAVSDASAAATQPAPSATTLSESSAETIAWTGQVQQLIAVAESRAEQARARHLDNGSGASPTNEATRRLYVESQVQLRMLYLMAGDQARAMQVIPGLDAADQEFWQQVLWGVSNYFDDAALPNRADRMTQTVEQLRTAVTRLQGAANLQLRNVAFCRKITSFGNFERFERDEYSPGQRVLLYAEALNFKSIPQPADGLYKTQLKSTVEILRSGESQPATKIDFEPTIDLCRSYRQDYFHSYELKIPADLGSGAHVLKLTVEDMQSGKLATYSLNFSVK